MYKAVHQMGKWKSPGPDGLAIGFYVDNWSLVYDFVYGYDLGMLSGLTLLSIITLLTWFLYQRVKLKIPQLILGQ